MALLVATTGCARFAADHPLLQRRAAGAFDAIAPIDLRDHSRSSPVTIEEATATPPTLATVTRPAPPATVELDLPEVRRAALANNLELAIERIGPNITQRTIDEEEARFDAVLSALASVRQSQTSGPGGAVTSDFVSLSPGVRIPMRTGGTALLSLPWTRSQIGAGTEAQTTDIDLSISQPLLRNAGVAVNTAPIQSARLRHRQQEARTKLTAIRVLANAERAYWNHWAAARQVETQHQLYQSSLEQLRRAQRLVDAGVLAEVEVLRSEAGVSRQLESIIRAENTRRRTERALKRIMNREDLPVDSTTALLPASDASPLGLDLDRTALARLALENRLELIDVELQLVIDAINTSVAENGLLPSLVLDFTYSAPGDGREFADSIDRLLDFDDYSIGVGLSGEIPIGNRAPRARYRRALLRRQQTLASQAQREQQILEEIGNSADQLEQAWQRILAARQEVVQAERTLEAEQRQFQAGIRTSTEVFEAVNRVADAQGREIDAIADYQNALVDVAFATGTLLGHSRIRWS